MHHHDITAVSHIQILWYPHHASWKLVLKWYARHVWLYHHDSAFTSTTQLRPFSSLLSPPLHKLAQSLVNIHECKIVCVSRIVTPTTTRATVCRATTSVLHGWEKHRDALPRPVLSPDSPYEKLSLWCHFKITCSNFLASANDFRAAHVFPFNSSSGGFKWTCARVITNQKRPEKN